MSTITIRAPTKKGRLLPSSPIAESVNHRAEQVRCLVQRRRKLALAYKRNQDESSRLELELIDHDLAQYRIDIPAIQRSAARGK
jgi:hypothetical protein